MSKLLEMRERFPQTQIWVDSCAQADLEYGLSLGAVGATTNPVIVSQVLQKELTEWEPAMRTLFDPSRALAEDEAAWKLIEQMGVRGSRALLPVYERSGGTCGKLSMQTNIKYYHDWEKMADQAAYFHSLAPNIQVKMPISAAGLKAFEEATYRGVSVNATVSFSVAQAVALAEAVERGLERRRDEGLDDTGITPVCTIMLGRIDDWLKKVVAQDRLTVMPEALEWAGIAVFKRAYEIFRRRGYRTRLLTAAYRNANHWYQLVGGDVSMTLTANYLRIFDSCGWELKNNMDQPVPQRWLDELMGMKEFRRAYEEDGMTPEEFEHYGAFITCLEGFFKGYETLLQLMRPYQFGRPLDR